MSPGGDVMVWPNAVDAPTASDANENSKAQKSFCFIFSSSCFRLSSFPRVFIASPRSASEEAGGEKRFIRQRVELERSFAANPLPLIRRQRNAGGRNFCAFWFRCVISARMRAGKEVDSSRIEFSRTHS